MSIFGNPAIENSCISDKNFSDVQRKSLFRKCLFVLSPEHPGGVSDNGTLKREQHTFLRIAAEGGGRLAATVIGVIPRRYIPRSMMPFSALSR